MRGVFGQDLTIGPDLVTWANQEMTNRITPSNQLRAETRRVDSFLGDKLLEFQDPGTLWLVTAQRGLLGDDMGTGKTVQVIAALLRVEALGGWPWPFIGIVPNSTKGSIKSGKGWAGEFAKWAPHVTVFVVTGSATKRRKLFEEAEKLIADGQPVAVIINWESVRLHSRLAGYGSIRLKRCPQHGGPKDGDDDAVPESKCEVHERELNRVPWTTVVVDEAHRMKDPKSKQTRGIWAVQHQDSVWYSWALTGTPIADHIGDLWPIMHGIAPEDYPTKTSYLDRYALMSWNDFGGLDIIGVRPDTRDEFFRILDPRFRRMPKELVLKYLPSKVRDVRYAEMSAKQERAYRSMEKDMVMFDDDGNAVISTNNLTTNTRLLQFSSAYCEVNEAGEVRLTDPSSKLDVLDGLLTDIAKPFVVCAESRQLIELACARLDKQGVPYRKIVGGMTDDQREAAKADWIAGKARVFLFTIKAGGTGLDGLQAQADTIVFLQRSWSMLENKQAEDRVHRIGSEVHGDHVHIIDVVSPGTVEEKQIMRLYEKAERLEELVRDRAVLAAQGQDTSAYDAEISTIENTPLWAA
jgi:ATP-dependent helicase STH1/SNF2